MIGRIKPQHVTIILDRCAAAGRRDDDRVETARLDLARPHIDIVPRLFQRLLFAAHMVDQRTAAAFALRCHHFDAEAVQKPQGGGIDTRIEHRLRAAVENCHATALFSLGSADGFNRGR